MLLALAAFAAAPAYADGTQVLYVKEAVSSALGSADGPGDHSYAMRMAADVVAAGLGSLREADSESADLVHIGVLDLYSEASQGGDLSEKAAQVREALGRIEPVSPDPALAASLLLGSADEAYQEHSRGGNEDAYELSRDLVARARALSDAAGHEERLFLELESFWDELESMMEEKYDFHPVGTLIAAISRDLTGHELGGHDEAHLYANIRSLYSDMSAALEEGDYALAEELCIEAYLENFEYLEANIERADPDLLYELEWQMREDLRDMIKEERPAHEILSFLNETILPSLTIAQAMAAVSSSGPAPEKDLLDIGSATEDQKSEVRSEIDFIRDTLREAVATYEAGDAVEAHALARTAYLDSYEYVEVPLRAIDPDFTLEVEFQFAELRSAISRGEPAEDVQALATAIDRNLDESERLVSGPGTLAPAIAFTSSFAIIFREGLESVLILGVILMYLESSRNTRFSKYVYYGVAAAVAATAATWAVASYLIEISGADRELIEAVAALSATAVLFYVSFWVLGKLEHRKWMEFVKAKVWQATATGSASVFVMLAFFTVYREGFETVLFYQAMSGFARYMEGYVALGFVLGLASLLVIYWAVRRLGKKLPLRALFGLTMGVGAYLSIAFLGNGVRELQVIDVVPYTSLLGTVPRLDINTAAMTGIYPTLETVVAQILLLSVYLGASLYVLVLRPRRAARLESMRVSRKGHD